MSCTNLRAAAAATLCLVLSGCGSSSDTPDGAIRHVLSELASDNPRAVWDALPASWQGDLHGLLHRFADKLDPEIYGEWFAVARRFLRVVDGKQDLVLAQLPPFFPRDSIEPMWQPVLAVAKSVTESEISTLQGLRHLDLGEFLGTTGRQLMATLMHAAAEQGEDPRGVLRSIRVEMVSSDGDSATVQVKSDEHGISQQIPMTRVDGKWVPLPMSMQWSQMIAYANMALAGMPAMTDPATLQRYRADLEKAKRQLDAMEAATTAREFARAMRGDGTPARPR